MVDQTVIIAISGRPGSGKSAAGKLLAARLGLDHVSAGDFMREMAAEQGMSILSLSRAAEGTDAIDREIDARTERLGANRDGFVMDARLAWYFLPNSVKVFLDVSPNEAANRIYGAGRDEEAENVDLESTAQAIEARTRSESLRYEEYYGVDYLDPSHYDLVVDTTDLDIDGVVDRIIAALPRAPISDEDRNGKRRGQHRRVNGPTPAETPLKRPPQDSGAGRDSESSQSG